MDFWCWTDYAIKGLEIKHLPADQFLLRFNHIINHNRALAGCPWSFENNILILNGIGADENPMQVDLDWCNSFVQIHELQLILLNLSVATFIGNRIGKFRDMAWTIGVVMGSLTMH
ncbi:UNVERIFIED_CONTAM: hypothetical protein Slati_1170000 [Sesamum latifolium]|uniref:DUF4283 domain-containing protein n=1 Tax=Sesamum latifolium TaxID=2727402 RepID=A0AAW2XFE5_9LAMI